MFILWRAEQLELKIFLNESCTLLCPINNHLEPSQVTYMTKMSKTTWETGVVFNVQVNQSSVRSRTTEGAISLATKQQLPQRYQTCPDRGISSPPHLSFDNTVVIWHMLGNPHYSGLGWELVYDLRTDPDSAAGSVVTKHYLTSTKVWEIKNKE